ncbi:uncharacterized protein LOC119618063 [Kryptolebias marmoratus]|uniref:uncharacterized protein LOC119618063 n=1 Tax=Kryptolebias marmoratus TaxID=37003 RepID=UPI0018ACAB58|nr:uncharacterized protein LOC119618063 [Kryptolebias marmoratus]
MDYFALHLFVIVGVLHSYDAQTTFTTTSPTAQTAFTNISVTARQPVATTSLTDSGCAGPPMICCASQNNSCQRGGCYCDEYCLNASDCCSDFVSTCNVSIPLNQTAPSDGISTTNSTPTDVQTVIIILKARLVPLNDQNINETFQAFSDYLRQDVFQQRCRGCNVSVKRIDIT